MIQHFVTLWLVTAFLRDCGEAIDWINEKKIDLDGSESHHDQWQKALALSAELSSNQTQLEKIRQTGKWVQSNKVKNAKSQVLVCCGMR